MGRSRKENTCNARLSERLKRAAYEINRRYHPWLDGNGRTSRLLMNYIQFYHDLIPTKIYKEDKADYITSLIESREKEENLPFRTFMLQQHLKSLREEIAHHRQSLEKEPKLLF
jgi:Fic family protein